MTDLTTPGEIGAAADNKSTAFAYRFCNIHPLIATGAVIGGEYSSIDTSGINGFEYNSSASSGLTAVFDGGEAFVWGWICRDTQTSVDLPANDKTTVSVGYNPDASLGSGESAADSSNITLDVDSAFNALDPKTELYDITTDGSSITGVTDRRRLGNEPIEYDNFERSVKVIQEDGSTRAFDVQTDSGRVRAHQNFEVQGEIFEFDGQRIYYDRNKNDKTVHIQRDSASSETAITLLGTNVGIDGQTNPQQSLDVNGVATASDGFKAPDFNGSSLPSDTEAGRIVYDSSRES